MLAVARYEVQASHLITAGYDPNVGFGLVNQALFGKHPKIQIFQRIVQRTVIIGSERERDYQHKFDRNRQPNSKRGNERQSKRPFPPSHHPSPRRSAYGSLMRDIAEIEKDNGAKINAMGGTRDVCPWRQRRLPDYIRNAVEEREVMPKAPTEEELRIEVEELADLLRTNQGLAKLRAALTTRHLGPEDVVLGGLIESEEEKIYGVFVNRAGECTIFEILRDEQVVRWDRVEDPSSLAINFPAINVAIAVAQKL